MLQPMEVLHGFNAGVQGYNQQEREEGHLKRMPCSKWAKWGLSYSDGHTGLLCLP